MCLHSIDKDFKSPRKDAVTTGWKVFWVNRDRLQPLVVGCRRNGYPIRRWVTARRTRLGQPPSRYMSGFHAFLTEADARCHAGTRCDCAILEVELRHVRIKGMNLLIDGQAPCVVADQMRIPRWNHVS